MATYNFNYLYIGRLPVADTYEGDFDNESNAQFLTTFDSSQLAIAPVTVVDDDNLGDLMDDEVGSTDSINYSFNGPDGPVNYSGPVDSTFYLFGTVTYQDGTTADAIFPLIQATNGDTFVLDSAADILDNASIDSIRFDFVAADQSSGHFISPHESISNSSIACFLDDTNVETFCGPKPVQALQRGDMVWTLDGGFQPIRWIGRQMKLVQNGPAAIQIEAGALGRDSPAGPLRVSHNHRILVGNAVSARMFDKTEILVAAKALLPLPGVWQVAAPWPVAYWHFAFDDHQLVQADGAWAESLHPGPMARRRLSHAVGLEIKRVRGGERPLARLCPPMRQQRQFVMRSLHNGHDVAPVAKGRAVPPPTLNGQNPVAEAPFLRPPPGGGRG